VLVGVVVYGYPTFAVMVLAHLTVAAAINMTLHTDDNNICTVPVQELFDVLYIYYTLI